MAKLDDPRKRDRFGAARVFAIVLGIAAILASAEFYALWRARHADAPVAVTPAKVAIEGPLGAIDTPVDVIQKSVLLMATTQYQSRTPEYVVAGTSSVSVTAPVVETTAGVGC